MDQTSGDCLFVLLAQCAFLPARSALGIDDTSKAVPVSSSAGLAASSASNGPISEVTGRLSRKVSLDGGCAATSFPFPVEVCS
ncbi:hypothetical protein CPB85DRAFT_23649 [Mucidula mucida]|nr:hypothetical protein CPB85DRAFT_23649 [Mucidula mucida]